MHLLHHTLSILFGFAALPGPDDAAGEVTWSPPVPVEAPSAEAPPPATESSARPLADPREAESKTAGKPRKRARDRHAGGRSCKRGKAGCNRGAEPTAPPVEAPTPEEVGLLEARAQRAQVLGLAQPLAAAGRSDEAARIAASAADQYEDPVLYIAAAAFDLADPKADRYRLARADRMTGSARRLLAEPSGWRIAADEAPLLREGADELAKYAMRRQTRLLQLRRGKAELACGSAFLAAGLAGVGVLLTGAVMTSRVRTMRDVYSGGDEAYLATLDESGARAKALIAAGTAITVVGAAIGIPLTVAGVQERRRARKGVEESPSFRVVPGGASVSITGRF